MTRATSWADGVVFTRSRRRRAVLGLLPTTLTVKQPVALLERALVKRLKSEPQAGRRLGRLLLPVARSVGGLGPTRCRAKLRDSFEQAIGEPGVTALPRPLARWRRQLELFPDDLASAVGKLVRELALGVRQAVASDTRGRRRRRRVLRHLEPWRLRAPLAERVGSRQRAAARVLEARRER